MTWDLFTSAEATAKVAEPVRRPSPVAADVAAVARQSMRMAAGPAGEDWTVSAVNRAAKELVEGVFPPLWIAGEVANITRARSGHCYFTLRDDCSQLRCVMWRDDARRLPILPEEGMSVRVYGRLTIYPARGDFQLTALEVEAKGEGLWKLALEKLRKKLEAEGLTAAARKRPLPRYPRVIAVVTSPSGAVFHDIVNVIRRRAPWTRVVLAGCRVQGEGAAREVAAAIRQASARAGADVLIVGRGGGSVEDLWAFNEEIVARAIASSPIPVISAVGHETDVTIADLVADLRAPTPSAAAESAVPDRADLARGLQRDAWRLRRAVATRLGRAQERVEGARMGLLGSGERMTLAHRERLRIAARQLEALSPLSAFTRGFSVAVGEDGKVLRRRADFAPRTDFQLRVSDGSVACRAVEDDPPGAEAPQLGPPRSAERTDAAASAPDREPPADV